MILYFSATGNTRFAAQSIAQAIGDARLMAIDECVRNGQYEFALTPGEVLGICCPTYDWGIPRVVMEFLEQARFTGVDYSFALTTFGTYAGQSTGFIRQLLRRQPIQLSAAFTVRTTDVWTPMFDLSDAEKNQRRVDAERPQIEDAIVHIQRRDCGNFAHRLLPMWACRLVYSTYDNVRRTSHLHVTDDCIGCGLCAQKCPRQAITMVDGRPTWTLPQCEMCLGCLHRCPRFSIQYDNKTQHHGQYQHHLYEK